MHKGSTKGTATKIDIYSHILPVKYKEVLYQRASSSRLRETIEPIPTPFELEARFRILDKYGWIQVLTLALPPIKAIAESKEAAELARIANDEMAELVVKYPDRFVAGIASADLQ